MSSTQSKASFTKTTYLNFRAQTLNFLKDFIYLFLERGEGKEKERERNIDWLFLTRDQTGGTTTQACVPTRNPPGVTLHFAGRCPTN